MAGERGLGSAVFHLPICPSATGGTKIYLFCKGQGVCRSGWLGEKNIFHIFKKIACGIGGKTITYILRVWQLTSCTNRSSRLAYFVIFSISLRRTSISLLKFKSFPGRIGTRNGRRREHCRKRSQKALLLRGITVLQFQKHSKKQNQHRTYLLNDAAFSRSSLPSGSLGSHRRLRKDRLYHRQTVR